MFQEGNASAAVHGSESHSTTAMTRCHAYLNRPPPVAPTNYPPKTRYARFVGDLAFLGVEFLGWEMFLLGGSQDL